VSALHGEPDGERSRRRLHYAHEARGPSTLRPTHPSRERDKSGERHAEPGQTGPDQDRSTGPERTGTGSRETSRTDGRRPRSRTTAGTAGRRKGGLEPDLESSVPDLEWSVTANSIGGRVLLDTNVWSNLAEHRAVDDVQRVARKVRVQIVACPAVVYEILRSPDPNYRRRDLRAITRRAWTRPMTEIFEQSQQPLHAIRSRHPEWLVDQPDLRWWHRLKWDWAGDHPPSRGSIGGFWWRARNDPSRESRMLAATEGDRMEKARESQRSAREAMGTRTFEQTVLKEWTSKFDVPTPGCDGTPFATWRGDSIRRWTEGLFDPSAPPMHREWLAPFLDLTRLRVDFPRWVRFWVDEVSEAELLLEWLAWAFQVVSSKRRLTRGTPGDCQIGLYLADCERFVTCDKTFAEIAERSPTRHHVSSLSQLSSRTTSDALR
jgi:hypothetical protein